MPVPSSLSGALAVLLPVASDGAAQPTSRATPGDAEASGGDGSSIFVRDARRVLGRFLIVAGTAVVAMLAGASFGLFQSLVGSLGTFCVRCLILYSCLGLYGWRRLCRYCRAEQDPLVLPVTSSANCFFSGVFGSVWLCCPTVMNSVRGFVGAATLAYTIPAILHLKQFGNTLPMHIRIKDYIILAFGLTGALLGTLETLKQIALIHTGEAAPQ